MACKFSRVSWLVVEPRACVQGVAIAVCIKLIENIETGCLSFVRFSGSVTQ